MIVHLETETTVSTHAATVLVKRGGGSISSISLDGGTAGTGATLVINDSTDATGSDIWAMRAPQYGTANISFVKPIPFTDGIYITVAGTAPKVSLAYT